MRRDDEQDLIARHSFYLLTGWPGTLVQGLLLATSEEAGCRRREMTSLSRGGSVPADSHRTPWSADPLAGLEAETLCWSRRRWERGWEPEDDRSTLAQSGICPQGWPVCSVASRRAPGAQQACIMTFVELLRGLVLRNYLGWDQCETQHTPQLWLHYPFIRQKGLPRIWIWSECPWEVDPLKFNPHC